MKLFLCVYDNSTFIDSYSHSSCTCILCVYLFNYIPLYSLLPPSLPSLSWDDILVSAPVYSEPFRHELGRVIVYLNNKVIEINDT